jgi:biopolymer transport protein ExbD
MPKTAVLPAHSLVMLSLTLLLGAVGCSHEADATKSAEAAGPPLGVLELPVSLRTGDKAPDNARKVEVTTSELRVDDKVVLKLEGSRVPAAEQKDGVITKLSAALANPARGRIALHAHASLPYETAALVLNTASAAGMHQLTLRVRKPGGSTETGWLSVDAFQMTPRTYDEVPLQGVEARAWDEFAAAWQAMHDACRASQTATCAYVESSVAKGGKLKLVLFAAGSGVNVNVFRVGLTPADLAAEEQRRKAELASKKEDAIQGRAKRTDVEKDLAEGEPATEALFQFRAQEALDPPSAVSAVMQPLCGTKPCGAVVSAESNTLMVRVVSLIGAAYSEGASVPPLAFEMSWTPKPKAPSPPPAVSAEPPAAPSKADAKNNKKKHKKKKK